MAHATKLVPFRVNVIYMISIVFITILIPSDDPNLLGGSGVAASPFVIAIRAAGIPALPSILNVGIMCGLLAIAAESVYIASRILRTMSHQRIIPEVFAKVDSRGRPRMSLIVTCVTGVFLAYINLSGKFLSQSSPYVILADRKAGRGQVGFSWLLSITSAAYFSVWIIISFTNYRFRQAVKAQGDPLLSGQYAWRSNLWPLAPAWLMAVSVLLLVCCIFAGVNPVVSTLICA
jgi:yeast amino acid transporter